MDWGEKWLVDFNAGKTQLVWFDRSNKNGSIDVKMHGSVLEEKLSFDPIQDGFFRGCSRIGGPSSLKSVTHILQ